MCKLWEIRSVLEVGRLTICLSYLRLGEILRELEGIFMTYKVHYMERSRLSLMFPTNS